MKSVTLTLPLSGHVTGSRVDAKGRTIPSGDENNIVAPPSLQHMMFWAKEGQVKAKSEVISHDLKSGTAEVKVTSESDSWIDALTKYVEGRTVDELREAVQKIDLTQTQPDYKRGVSAKSEAVTGRFKLEVD